MTMAVLSLIGLGCTADVEIKSRAEAPQATLVPASEPDDAFVPQGCDRRTIGEEFGPIEVAYAVDNGRLSTTPCFGDASPVVEAAWNELAQITPPQLISGVTILAGFDDARSDTLAFAGPVEDDSDDHLIAVGVAAAVDDPQELRLTMAHELAHVFTQTTDQIDVAFFADECETFFNGFGCFQPDAYMTDWVDRFWSATALESLPSDYSADIAGGEARCDLDAGFPGSYAASHPEEDFAESFSAYVFDVDLAAAFDERRAFFDERPEFVAMRQAIRRTAEGVPPGNFTECG